jgi:DNA-binding transcriptional LysR family regulator
VRTELEIRHLRTFVTLVEEGGHTRAARTLGVSQSTVSETLSALERTLGTELLRKGGKGVALTPSGEALLPYARRILALTSELVTNLANVSADVKGTLVVSAVESLGTYVLPARLASLRERWPKVSLEVATRVCVEIRESVASGKSDLGLVLEVDSGVEDGWTLAKARLVVFAAPGHPLAGREASVDELRRCDFYMCDAAGDYHQVLRKHFEAAEVPLPRTQALGSVEAVKRGILAGGTALGLLPAHAVRQELDDGVFAEVTVKPTLLGLVMRAVVGPSSAGSPLVEDLIQNLRGMPLG